ALAFTACTKEIDLDLDDKSNKVVIEASVNEGTGPHTVRLSRSVAFDTPNDFPAISNATVVLSDDQGNSEQLIETSPGMYSSSTLAGVQGRNYQLSTTVSGTTYTAQCRMPPAVPLDTVRIDSLFVFGTYEKLIFGACSDPVGTGNNYRYVVRVNGERLKGFVLQNDLLEDGHTIEQPLNFGDDAKLYSGDLVEVTMECITAEVYRYFFSHAQNIGGDTSAPSDPPSNISGGALGYFSAHTASTKNTVVP
ncbi:MAG: DUF4249 domain-containing protein, partial [Flavobacteriales bacterium]|nr:DUF4249 domain-containing protein [Flavobacteriales bacterium]